MNPSQEPAAHQYEQAPQQATQYDQVQQHEHDEPPVYPYGPPAEMSAWEPPRPTRRPLRRTLLAAASVTTAMAVAGAPLGLLWSWLSPSVPVINAGQNGVVVNDPSPEEFIAADGWFTLIGFTFGLVAAVIIWLVLRRDRGPGLLLGVSFGGLATALVMWGVGRLIGLSAWNDWQDSSGAGETFNRPPDLHSYGALLVVAFAAVIVTTLLAGWSNDPDLERPGAKPGYGHDLGAGYPGQNELGPNELGPNNPSAGGPSAGGPSAGGPSAGGPSAGGPSAGGTSSGSPAEPDLKAAPAPPAPWPADPPRG